MRRNRVAAGIAAAALVVTGMGAAATSSAATVLGKSANTFDRVRYADQMSAMWMAECFANWTGLTTEGARPNGSNLYGTADPFYTDADWGKDGIGRGGAKIQFANPDPCGGDDDTDIEYSYLNEMAVVAKHVKLTPEEIAHMWNTNIESFVWFSDSAADLLMLDGARSPSTSLSAANQHRNIIDAQLVTEFFGALAPGRPDIALDIAQLPVRAVAGGFATHAAQFNVVAYSLASVVPEKLTPEQQIKWIITEARKYLPSESRASEIVDWVTREYNAHPGDKWETLRDKIYQRYQVNSVSNGFNYIIKYEAAINFAAQIAELLYGKGDLTRTVQIGTLFGWDSDNPTASNAGLIGLMRGTHYVEQELVSEGLGLTWRYNAYRTRVNLPDYLPNDDLANDTFTMMGYRALPLIDQVAKAAGGKSDAKTFTIPTIAAPTNNSYATVAKFNPDTDIYIRSANNQVRVAGGTVTVASNLVGNAALYTLNTSHWPAGRMMPTPIAGADLKLVADGFDSDTRGKEEWARVPFFAGSSGSAKPVVTVTYNKTVKAEAIRLIGGGIDATGGWVKDASVEVRGTNGKWAKVLVLKPDTPFNSAQPFQQIDLKFLATKQITGFRVTFTPTAAGRLNITEADAVAPATQMFKGLGR